MTTPTPHPENWEHKLERKFWSSSRVTNETYRLLKTFIADLVDTIREEERRKVSDHLLSMDVRNSLPHPDMEYIAGFVEAKNLIRKGLYPSKEEI